jgi:hypothetical protein
MVRWRLNRCMGPFLCIENVWNRGGGWVQCRLNSTLGFLIPRRHHLRLRFLLRQRVPPEMCFTYLPNTRSRLQPSDDR